MGHWPIDIFAEFLTISSATVPNQHGRYKMRIGVCQRYICAILYFFYIYSKQLASSCWQLLQCCCMLLSGHSSYSLVPGLGVEISTELKRNERKVDFITFGTFKYVKCCYRTAPKKIFVWTKHERKAKENWWKLTKFLKITHFILTNLLNEILLTHIYIYPKSLYFLLKLPNNIEISSFFSSFLFFHNLTFPIFSFLT